MITEYDDIIHAEILFDNQTIDDNSENEYRQLLLYITHQLELNAPIKKIKKHIFGSTINDNAKDVLQKLVNQQASVITEEEESINLAEIVFMGYTLKELLKMRKQTTQKKLVSFMARVKEHIKAGEKYTHLVEQETRKYMDSLEAFYRTPAKQAREFAYDKIDRRLSKQLRGWISVAVLDNRTSVQCVGLHNEFYSRKDYATRFDVPNPPPRHIKCRSELIPVWEDTRITDYKGQKLETFFKNNPEAAISIMGQKKYRMWKTGKAKVKSYIDIKGKRFWRNDEIVKRLGIRSRVRLKKIEGD